MRNFVFPAPRWAGCGRFLVASLAALANLASQPSKPEEIPEEAFRDPTFFHELRSYYETPRPVEYTLRVLYYDPGWQLLWAMANDQEPVYLRASKQPMAIAPGQLVRIRGTIDHTQGLYASPDKIEILDSAGLPPAIPAEDRLHDFGGLGNRLVTIDAYVDRQDIVDESRARIHAVVHGRRILLRVPNIDASFPDYTGSFVSATGIYVHTPASGSRPPSLEIWCPTSESLTRRNTLANDARFTLPTTQIESLRQAPSNEWVRVVGTMNSQEPGRSLTLRDDTGQVTVLTAQQESLNVGALVEAIGYPEVHSADIFLASALYRPLAADGLPGGRAAKSNIQRFVDQINLLTPEDIAAGQIAEVTGSVTWAQKGGDFLYLQDATGGIRVQGVKGDFDSVEIGSILRIRGPVIQGPRQLEIGLKTLHRGADGAMRSPRAITLDQAVAGVAESQWIELTGFLRHIEKAGTELVFHFTTPSGEFTAETKAFRSADSFLDSVIRVRGVCTTLNNSGNDLQRVHLLVPSPDDFSIEAALPSDLTALPLQSIHNLNARGVRTDLNRWVRTTGLLTLHVPGSYLYLQEGDNSLRVLARENKALLLGDRVEVVGLLGREAGKQVLREARILTATSGDPTVLKPTPAGVVPTPSLDGQVVTVTGVVLDTIDSRDQKRVIVQAGERLVEAQFVNPAKNYLPNRCQPGATVNLTGIYHLELNDYNQPRNFTVLLRNPSDIDVRDSAPWWTTGRALNASLVLALGVLIAAIWVAFLRRRIQVQTVQLIAQKDKEARLEAELERSSRLESLGLLAGGIAHDFNNMLTVVVGNITLAAMETPSDSPAAQLLEEAEKGALRARELTQQLLAFARGGDPVRTGVVVPALVREAAEFALSGSKVGIEYDFSPNVPMAFADKGQLTQAIHNLVMHAAQSMPQGGKIVFSLRDTRLFDGDIPGLPGGTYLKLSVTDTGPGIASEHLGRVFEPYFQAGPNRNALGLATTHSIIKRHQGHIAVSSRVNEGTTFTIWLPTTNLEPVVEKPKTSSETARKSLKVLFLDDEEAIRRFAHTLMTRLGHEATTVADGAAAVHAYAAAFEINKPFDVVVLDLTIAGGMGGREALEHLQTIDPMVRAIVSSGYSDDQILSEYKRYGFSGIVSKPYKIGDLAQALQDVMDRPPAGATT